MKLKFYLSGALSICMLASMAQNSDVKQLYKTVPNDVLMEGTKAVVLDQGEAKGNDVEIFWSEDFSNGLDGQGDNGAWTTGGDQGDYWFISYPEGAVDGYDPAAPLTTTDVYGDIIPNFFGTRTTIPSTTADNGFMMLDCDRFNSIATDPGNTGAAFLTSNLVDATLTSPAMDLTGVDNALLTFWEQWRMCCNNYNIGVEFSVDDGTSWAVYDLFALNNAEGNQDIINNFAINISEQLQNAADLSQCRVRFTWDLLLDGVATHYFWMLDDINIAEIPENDIAIGETYFNRHFESEWLFVTEDTPELDLSYISEFEYWNQPEYITRPFNFAAGVTNNGTLEQTGVTLFITPFLDGVQLGDAPLSTAPISLAPGVTDTLRLYDQTPDWWVNPEAGVYTFEYELVQDAEDARPDDNVGAVRSTRISTDADNGGFAIMQNDRNAFTNFYPQANLAEDIVFANRHVFTEADVDESEGAAFITHVEFVLVNPAEFTTIPGETVFVNVRTGSSISPLTDENPNFRYFEEDEVDYTIEEEDISDGTTNWISVELPTPVLIEPGVIYQAEMETPSIGLPAVYIALSNLQEPGSGLFYDFGAPAATPQGWSFTGGSAPMIRFRTSVGFLSNDDITYESGIKLTQNYPNPVVDNTMIQFQLDDTSPVNFEVFDITGKLVHMEDLGNVPARSAQIITFNSSALAAGTYTYSIVTENERVTRKMIIE